MVQLTGDYIMAETEKKQLKTFSLHEKNMKYVAMMKKAVLRYKHVENMLNNYPEQGIRNYFCFTC